MKLAVIANGFREAIFYCRNPRLPQSRLGQRWVIASEIREAISTLRFLPERRAPGVLDVLATKQIL